MIKRAMAIVAIAFLLGSGLLLTVGGNSVDQAPGSIIILNDGQVIVGQPFIVDDQSLSMLTDQGMRTFPRAAVHSLSFLTPSTLVLRAQGAETEEGRLEGKLFYVGDLRDGHPAGTFSAELASDPNDNSRDPVMIRMAGTFTDGSTLSSWGLCHCQSDHTLDGILSHQITGVINEGTGLFAYATGPMDFLVDINVVEEPATATGYFIFHFREPLDP